MNVYLWITVPTIAWVLSSEQVFDRTRRWVRDRSVFLGEGISCSFCVGGWVSLLLLPFVHCEVHIYPLYYFTLVGWSGLVTTLYSILRQLHKLVQAHAKEAVDKNDFRERQRASYLGGDKKTRDLTHKDRLSELRRSD